MKVADPANCALSLDDVRRLLDVATSTAVRAVDLAERRRLMLLTVGEIIDADAGHWAWGRGDSLQDSVVPVAIIDFGYSNNQRAIMIDHALKPESIAGFQKQVAGRFAAEKRATITRRELFSDDDWRASSLWSDYVARLGFDSFLHSIRYRTEDTWSCFHFLRCTGREEFGPHEADIVHLALNGIEWLTTQAEEIVPAAVFAGITPRQRTVMLMLLDGMTRKQIAGQLVVSEDTVGDHITGVYQHFGVRSAGELAAKFLKGR